MRILFDFDNDEVTSEVVEVVSVNMTRAWESTEARDNGDPGDMFIEILRADSLPLDGNFEDVAILGSYDIDGDREAFNKAMANWKAVQKKLLEKGFCRISDFENVEWV